MLDSQQAVASIAVLFLSILLFLFLAVSLYRFLRLVWARLPTRALYIQGADLDKLIAITIALVAVPSIPRFAWTTAQSLFKFIAEQIRRLGVLSFSTNVNCPTDPVSCFATNGNSFLGQMADGLVRSLDLESFRIGDFVLFLLLAIIVAQLLSQLRQGFEAGRISQWLATANVVFPKQTRERVVFAGLVLLAFYLGLAALLAIPLFQDKSQSQNLTVDALDKAMEPNTIKIADFDKSFPEALPPIRDVAEPKIVDSPATSSFSGAISGPFLSVKTPLQRVSAELQENWISLRQSALNDQTGLRDQAKSAFASGLEVGIGRKQTAQHYYDLFLWHQSAMLRLKNSLRECQSRASSFNNAAGQMLEQTRIDLQAIANFGDLKRRTEEIQRKLDDTFPTVDAARTACHPGIDEERGRIPRRNSFVDSLGTVGNWSKWLLTTEQMPVVIIVGLVGFSLLGATVSRAVRTPQTDPNVPSARLSLDDLVTVIAVGTTSAVVVFLAAYGGLAVLGGSTGDPNPYVLFATCLIGAVYSEDVWIWARTKGLANRQGSERGGAERSGEATQQSKTPAKSPIPSADKPPNQISGKTEQKTKDPE
jgi:hypothetical protein